ncbi:hypothetical protein ACJX0J_016940 [Zea mays]
MILTTLKWILPFSVHLDMPIGSMVWGMAEAAVGQGEGVDWGEGRSLRFKVITGLAFMMINLDIYIYIYNILSIKLDLNKLRKKTIGQEISYIHKGDLKLLNNSPNISVFYSKTRSWSLQVKLVYKNLGGSKYLIIIFFPSKSRFLETN